MGRNGLIPRSWWKWWTVTEIATFRLVIKNFFCLFVVFFFFRDLLPFFFFCFVLFPFCFVLFCFLLLLLLLLLLRFFLVFFFLFPLFSFVCLFVCLFNTPNYRVHEPKKLPDILTFSFGPPKAPRL